jgi:hypothetical protein
MLLIHPAPADYDFIMHHCDMGGGAAKGCEA